MVDTLVVVAIVAPLGAAIAGLLIAQVYRHGDKKENKVDDRRALEIEVERTAQQKAVTEEAVAEKLRDVQTKTASEVKTEARGYVEQLFDSFTKDINLMKVEINNKIDTSGRDIVQISKDLEKHFADDKEEFTKLEGYITSVKKTLELMQTMAWGPDAKSIPKWLLGQEESQEHKDAPEKGAFKKGPS